MSTIHWDSRNVWGLMPARAVQLWCIYAAMVNRDGVAWPSLANLTAALRLKDKGAAIEARRWLVDHGALEIVRGYIPLHERKGPATHDQRMFVRLTGSVTIDDIRYTLLYAPGDEAGADAWRSMGNPTLVGNIPLPMSENSHHDQSEISHPNVVQEESDGVIAPPPFEPQKVNDLRNDTLAQANGWQLVEAYSGVTNIPAETIWLGVRKTAAGLVRAGITPDDVREFITEMKRTPERYNGYRFNYMAEDLPRWKQQRAEKPAPRVVSDIERAQREAERKAEQAAWWKENGLS